MINQALVIGATGGTGAAITAELLDREIPTAVFGRNGARLKRQFNHVPVFSGDVFDEAALVTAIRTSGADTVFQCAAVPQHAVIDRQLALAQTVINAARVTHARVIFIDGITAFGDADGVVTERTPLHPNSQRGHVNQALYDLIFTADVDAFDRLLVRLPDYFGPTARHSSTLGSTLRGIAAHHPTFYLGSKMKSREFIYLPDAAKMIVTIAFEDRAYNQTWHIPGQVLTGHRLLHVAKQVAHTHVPVITLNRPLIGVTGIFNRDFAAVRDLYYLTQRPVLLDRQKYRAAFGAVPVTPLQASLTTTIQAYQQS